MTFLRLKGKTILAPMAGITNLPFRIICKEYGAAAVFTEMISSDAIINGSIKTQGLIRTENAEKPVGVQLFGSNPKTLAKAAEMIQHDFDFLDINMGCSVAKVIKQKSGVYLMNHLDNAAEIISKVSDAIDIPLTIKIRSGFDSINAVEIASIAEQSGAAAVTVHPRTAIQGFSGSADWNIIKQVKESVDISVIGNGDIKNAYDAERMLSITGCDYIMVGRAAIGNPSIFRQINDYLDKGNIIEQKPSDRISDFLKYIEIAERFKIISFNDIRVKAQQFTKGIEGSCRLRSSIGQQRNIAGIKKLIDAIA